MTPQDTTQQRNRPQTAQRRDAPASAPERRDRPAGRRRLGVAADGRGVSEVLGAILMFGLLISLLVLIQVNAVPAQNQQVEFEHNQRVEQDMLGLDRAILESGMMGVPGSAELEMAAQYPSRFFLLNPSVGAGTVETIGEGDITISGAHLPSVSNYWNPDEGQDFSTTSIRYRPNYKEYRNAPVTVYEHNTLANVFSSSNLSVDSGGFINGDRITLVTVDGSFSHAGSRGYALETTPISGPAQTVTLESDEPDEPIVLTLPTTLSERYWESVLEGEPNVDQDSIVVNNGELTVELDPGTYELRMARVGVDESVSDSDLSPHYLAAVTGEAPQTMRLGETKSFSVQVRDEYNNPVEGTVTFEAKHEGTPDGGEDDVIVSQTGLTSSFDVDADEHGRASAGFSPDETGTWTVTATINSGSVQETVTYEVTVQSVSGQSADDAVSNINPWETVEITDIQQLEDFDPEYDDRNNRIIDSVSGKGAELTFVNNIVPPQNAKMVEIRTIFYFSGNNQEPSGVILHANRDDSVSFGISRGWTNIRGLDINVPQNDDDGRTVGLEVRNIGSPNFAIIGIAIRYEINGGVVVTGNYFVQIPNPST